MCPYCLSKASDVILRVKGYSILKCSSCFLVYTDTAPGDFKNINSSTYDSNYVKNYERRKDIIKARFLEKVRLIEGYKQGGSLLDVGCSLGYFLQIAQQKARHAWQLFGFEANSTLAKMAKSDTKANIKVGALPKLAYKDKEFDVVTCFDVLEHSQNLKENLKEIRRVLKDDGLVVVQSPNYKSLMQLLTRDTWDWWSPPDHVLHFTPQTLTMALTKNGFGPIYKTTYEYTDDYLANIKGVIFPHKITRPLYYLLGPLLMLAEKIASVFGYGALILVIAKKS